MKKFLLLVAMLIGSYVYAQEDIEEKVDDVFYLNLHVLWPGISMEYFFEKNTSVSFGSSYSMNAFYGFLAAPGILTHSSLRYYYNLENRVGYGRPLQRHSGGFLFCGVAHISPFFESGGLWTNTPHHFAFRGGWGFKQHIGRSPWHVGGELGFVRPILANVVQDEELKYTRPTISFHLGVNIYKTK